jgi:lipoprotein-anchoring transpeptidase ErfK/SrfK
LARQLQDNQNQASYAEQELPAAVADLTAAKQRVTDLAYTVTGDAEAATHFNVPGADALSVRVARHAAAAAAAADAQGLAPAVAWLRVDQGRLGAAMEAALPPKAIYISTGRQELRAFDHGKLARQTLVTTGRPELPTVVGSWQVMFKSSPWKMHSPWPYGSRYWYPDTWVNYVLWFHEGGYGIHDAAWRYRYGPGTNVDGWNPGTHGCVNVPSGAEVWLFNWAQVGTPVTVGG